jgi:zinc protease
VVTRQVNVVRAVFRNRLTETIREREGASYSPGVGQYADDAFEGYGYLFATVEVKVEDVARVEALVKQIAAELRAGEISQDEFARAHTPILEDVSSTVQQNGYWLSALEDAQLGARGLNAARSLRPTYQAMTLADVRARAASLFDPARAYSIHIVPEE